MDIYINNPPNVVSIPKKFIKECLCNAPSDQVQALLAIIACIGEEQRTIKEQTGMDTDTIQKAIDYWRDRGVIYLDENANNIEIDFYSYQTVPVKSEDPVSADPKNAFREIISKLEDYIGRSIQISELQILLYASKDLGFSDELIYHLGIYCADRGSFKTNYIKTVALAWSENNVVTVEDAKAASVKYPKEVFTYLKLLGRKEFITPGEKDMVLKWIKDYQLSNNLITDTIQRSMKSAYVRKLEHTDKMLKEYYDKGIHTIEDKYK